MKTFEFIVIASGLDPDSKNFDDRFFEAGCDDATISIQKGAIVLEFARESKTFLRALWTALNDVEKAGAKVTHVEPDHLVSLSDISARTGLTRAAISHYVKGERGKNFPAPSARVMTESPLWDWVEVARWFQRQGRLPLAEVVRARVVRKINTSISNKRLRHEEFSRAA